MGKYNISSSNTNDLLIIGNGTFSSRSNILLVNTSSVQISGSLLTTGLFSPNSIRVDAVLYASKSIVEVTGSLTVSGSTIFVGTHTLSGSNTITGNTILSGSINVSGSSIFNNSSFIVTGSSIFKGTHSVSGSTSITGSFNVVNGDINVVSGSSFTRWGNKLFNYAQFANTASISATQNVSGAFALPLTYFGDGISVTNNSRITFANTGLYNIQFSTLINQGVGSANIHIWFKKTGSNIDNSGTLFIQPNNTQDIRAWNFAFPFSASEYIEMFYHTDAANTSFPATAAGSGFPLSPSVIVTVTQIA